MITHFNRDEPVKNLPDAYNKGHESNNAKILEIEKRAVDRLREAVSAIYDSLDIDNAYGKTLDLYGDMIGQDRGIATDEQYRILIKNRMIRNYSDADYNSIVNAICATFNAKPSDIILTELDEPCKIMLEGLPIAQINAANIDIGTAVQIIVGMLPAGVFMEAVTLSGTFEFSGTDLEYNEEAGFADEAQTIGGYLGLVSDSFGNNLPV